MRRCLGSLIVLVQVAQVALSAGPSPAHRSPQPVDAVASIIDAFRTHDIVAVTDPHGCVQVQALLLSLVRDPRFPDTVNDIVIETASARYQDAIDRFVRGDDIPMDVLRRAWEDHTVPNSLGIQAEEFIRAVRAVNASRTDGRHLRVIAGDPPIDWSNITSAQDHRRWIELRDSYPADLIRRLVLDRGRRALVVYGQGHLQRRQIASNYDMSTWQAQTVVSLLAHDDPAARVFTTWTLIDRNVALPDRASSWPVPSLVMLRGTSLGEMDFATFARGFGLGRFAVKDSRLVPLPRGEWRKMRMDDQFDALLYLGPPTSMTKTTIPAAWCHDAGFVKTRLRRLMLAGPPVAVQHFKTACGLK